MSHFPWKKYYFAANYRNEITFLIFDVKQRLIWHFPGVAIFCQGNVYVRDMVSIILKPSTDVLLNWNRTNLSFHKMGLTMSSAKCQPLVQTLTCYLLHHSFQPHQTSFQPPADGPLFTQSAHVSSAALRQSLIAGPGRYGDNTEMVMSSFWRNFNHWRHMKS